MKYGHALMAAFCAALLVACGGGGGGGATAPATPPPFERGVLLQTPPPQTALLAAAELRDRLRNGSTRDQALLLLSGDPVCDLDIRYIRYTTLGGAGEKTDASGALMVPRGNDNRCVGPRPVVLYAHATDPARAYNLANLSDTGNAAYNESLSLAALFAARGYIVVAPNYAGYDSSTLPYHPFLNAQQQSGDMMDALTAAKSALSALTPQAAAGAKLFVTGYSQGGHVAMATQRAMQQAGMAVTASAPMSGPYALAQELDDNFAGQVHIGATLFGTMLATSYQKSYGNIYTRPEDLYEANWAAGIEILLPGEDAATLGRTGKLPQFALFSGAPPQAPVGSGLQPVLDAMTPATGTSMDAVFARGFGTGNLFTNAARLAYLQDMLARPTNPAHGLRIDARANDLRGWTPRAPMLMCGGAQDATVSFSTNTAAMQRLWAGLPPGFITVLDLDAQPDGAADPFIAEKLGFGLVKGATEALARLQGEDPVWEVARNYHAAVFPFCASAASRFFSLF
jgi:hypothetical protein